MKVLIDTNVILDFFLQRDSFQEAATILSLIMNRNIKGLITASSITDIYYIARKIAGRSKAIEIVLKIFAILSVSDTKADSVFRAAYYDWQDFEDAVQYATAQDNNVDYIITRDKTGYTQSVIPVSTPTEFLSQVLKHE